MAARKKTEKRKDHEGPVGCLISKRIRKDYLLWCINHDTTMAEDIRDFVTKKAKIFRKAARQPRNSHSIMKPMA